MASMYGQRPRPTLKSGVDVQLQTAFVDENWPVVIRLADRRAKTQRDAYYEAVKACAEAQLDGLAEKSAAVKLVDDWVRLNVTPTNLEVLELLEWACAVPERPLESYADTLGTLRLRWVKANPRDVSGVIACLRECVLKWDLVNAQQISAVLDKSSNTNDRRFMFWSILLTFLLSISPQCADAKRAIYGMLAQKQLEKAAELSAASTSSTPDRSLRDEEELALYLRVLARRSPREELGKTATKLDSMALEQLKKGHKQLFLELLGRYEASALCDAAFRLCLQGLKLTDGSGKPSLLACDLRVWKSLVRASQQQMDSDHSLSEVQNLLNVYITAWPAVSPMYSKNLGLALLEVVFAQPPAVADMDENSSSLESGARVEQLLLFIDANLSKASVFDDIKAFIEKLSFGESTRLLEKLLGSSPPSPPEEEDAKTSLFRQTLYWKVRYCLVTCAQSVYPNPTAAAMARSSTMSCKFCSANLAGSSCCITCLEAVATSSLKLHRRISDDDDLAELAASLDKDPRTDLTQVAASSLLRLAGIGQNQGKAGKCWWSWAADQHRRRRRFFLQAILLLDEQLQQPSSSGDIATRLLLVRAYLALGCVSHALRLWKPLGVKRTILDALAPLCYDRLSTVAPGALASQARGQGRSQSQAALMDGIKTYYATVLREPSAVKIWDAFTAASYSSILDMAEFNDRLHRSCTRAMAVLEERRTVRAFGGKLDSCQSVPIFTEIGRQTWFENSTDHGSMPHLDSTHTADVSQSLSLGPELSNARVQLGLLAELYLDLVNFKAPKEYKPLKPQEAVAKERVYLVESLAMVESSMTDFLHLKDTPAALTTAEASYFTIISLLASLVGETLSTSSSSSSLAAATATSSILQRMAQSVAAVPTGETTSTTTNKATVFSFFAADLHTLGMLRDAAMAVLQTANFVLALHDKDTARDRSGGSVGFSKEALAQMRELRAAVAVPVLAQVKGRLQTTRRALSECGWLDAMTDWTTGEESDEGDGSNDNHTALSQAVLAVVGGTATVESWAGKVLDGWRETLDGWEQVHYD